VIPFLHFGWLTIPTYGLMVALAMLVSFYLLRADFRRRGIEADAELFIAIPCLAGIVGAKLYHVLESPADFFAHPWSELFSQFGFAWFGGLLAGFGAFVWLARRQGIPLVTMMDAGSPAAALGAAAKASAGIVFAAYLVLTGIARFLVEFIRINPRSFFGLTNAQAASLASIAAGIILWLQVRARSGTSG
jgi:prolipoprotein diacylglyceryltransferase